MDERKKTYEPAPEVPEELRERYQVILEVQSGRMTVTEGAKRLGLSRNHFQTLLHRGLAGLLEGIRPKPAGRPAKPAREAELESQLAELKKENERLQARVDTVDRLLGVASDLVRGRLPLKGQGRESPSASSKPTSSRTDVDEPDGAVRRALGLIEQLRSLGLSEELAAALAGARPSTVRRWRQRARAGNLLRRARGPRSTPPQLSGTVTGAARTLLREVRGQIGAAALSKAVPGISRRAAARLKAATLSELERERVRTQTRVVLTTPGVMRSFDAMHVRTAEGPRYLLVSADAAVPYRTGWLLTQYYDADAVAAELEEDFRRQGAPLVLRMDLASAHRTEQLRELLERWEVLLLHGPPRYPRFYGQLERQNRDHRAWLRTAGHEVPETVEEELPRMMSAMNQLLPRRGLGWRTPAQLWSRRPRIQADRGALRAEVEREANYRGWCAEAGAHHPAWRAALEQAMILNGWLRRIPGGWR